MHPTRGDCGRERLTLTGTGDSEHHGSIASVYIFVDGVSVLCIRYWGESTEPNLVAGFVSALASFAREVSNDGILKTVDFPPLKIVSLQVMEQPQVIVAITVREDFPIKVIEFVLHAVARIFLERYCQNIIDLKGVDLTPELGPNVHETIVRSLKEIMDELRNRDMNIPRNERILLQK
jgi:hypothetical protein